MKSIALLVALCSVARADQPSDRPQAFALDRDTTPPGQAELGFDAGGPVTAKTRGVGWAASLQLGYLDRPMRLFTRITEVYPVRRRETLWLGGAISIGSAVIADLRLPLAHQVGERNKGLGDERPLDRWVLGDIAVGARVRLAERARASLFARGQLTLGTGDDFDYAGDANYTAAWMLIGRFSLPHGVVLAGTAGVRFRGREVRVADRLLGDELFGAVGATYQLPPVRGLWCAANHVRLTGELAGVLGNDVAGQRGPSPAEARLGLISRIRPWLSVAGRIGRGLGDQIGAPRFRAMLELVYEGSAL